MGNNLRLTLSILQARGLRSADGRTSVQPGKERSGVGGDHPIWKFGGLGVRSAQESWFWEGSSRRCCWYASNRQIGRNLGSFSQVSRTQEPAEAGTYLINQVIWVALPVNLATRWQSENLEPRILSGRFTWPAVPKPRVTRRSMILMCSIEQI